MKKFVKNALIIASFVVAPLLTAGESEDQAAHKLLDLMQFEKNIDNSITMMVNMVKQREPQIEKYQDVVEKFFKKFMSGESFRSEVVKMYTDVFTADELDDISTFYMTKTGQKTLEKMPKIMESSMLLGRARVDQNMGELYKMLDEAMLIEESELQ